jgi:3-isopropylmalate/(R)-2-methylmalate dehydratase small subunit
MAMLKGRAWVFGDDLDTDQIIPARYLTTQDRRELGAHCLENTNPEFSQRVRQGDIVVGRKNFGCGSSREHAPIALQGAGVAAIVARSFARSFYRNSINRGLPLFETPDAESIRAGDELELDPDTGEIQNLTQGRTYRAAPLPEFAQAILRAGGLMAYVAAKKGLKRG